MLEPEFESDVPVPLDGRRGRSKGYSTAMHALSTKPIGTSIVLPCSEGSARGLLVGLVNTRRVPHGALLVRREGAGCRVWRVA